MTHAEPLSSAARPASSGGARIIHLPAPQAALRRPLALVRAARAGQAGYRRERDLPRLLGEQAAAQPPAAVLARLRIEEDALDQARRAGRGDYPMLRHVGVFIALLAEMQALDRGRDSAPAGGQVLCFSGPGKARPARHA